MKRKLNVLGLNPEQEKMIQHILDQIKEKSETWFIKQLVEAVTLANGDNREDAIRYIDELLKKYPRLSKYSKANLYYLRGLANRNMGNLKEGLANFDYAITLNPNREGIYYYDRAILKKQKGDLDGWQSDINTGREIFPEWYDDTIGS